MDTAEWRQLVDEHIWESFVQLNTQVVDLYEQGRYQEALPVAQHALELSQHHLHDDAAIVQSLNNLAGLYQAMEDYVHAVPLFQHIVVGLYEQGRYQEALPVAQHAHELSQHHLHDDAAIVQSLNNLAGLYQAMEDYAQAVPLFQQALAIRRTALGDQHLDVANSLDNLGLLYRAMRDYVRAEPLFQHALAIRCTVFGEEHPNVAQSFNNLAGLYRAMSDYKRAESHYEQALAIYRTALGDEHPEVAAIYNNLRMLYMVM
jgi:tetratricopeptide (TPR) repeat protein